MRRFGRIISFVLSLSLLGATAWGFFHRQEVYDWYRLRGYTPPASIQALATETTMNSSTRRLFYVQHPELSGRDSFNQNCGNISEVTIVLGCYISNQGIYVFNVDDDPRLNGVEQVTAAHELLHAAYDRLSDQEKARIDSLTQSAFQNLTDQRIIENIASYRQRDPSVVPNELHSILGTEVRNLPPELEKYYAQYFDNRAQIVTFSENYEAELTSRRALADSLEAQINQLKQQIDQLEQDLSEEKASLESQRSSVDTQSEVIVFNNRVDKYNSSVTYLNTLINKHNDLVEQYKANALEQQQLFKALSSKPTL